MNNLQIALEYAKSFIGTPYIWGGSHPAFGYDCSGFVQEILACVGLDPKDDQTAASLYHDLRRLNQVNEIPFGSISTGSVLFFGSGVDRITHVAWAIGELHMIEAGGGRKTTITVQAAINDQAFIRVRPISSRKDFVACLHPKY